MARKPARILATLAAALAAAVASGAAMALEWNLRPAGSKIAADIHSLHEYVMLLCTVIFIGVFAFMFYSVYAHRKDKGYKAAQFHENTTVEILWTVIPLLILIGIVVPATRTVIAQKDTSNPELTIKVTGQQWKWGYDYLKGEGEGINIMASLGTPRDQIEGRAPKGEHYLLEVGKDEELVVPVGKKVRMLTTAADVIHSWWVPAFGAKQDAIPGFIRDLHFTAEKTGTFRSQCVELCGKEHGFMPIVVKVVTQDEYTRMEHLLAGDAAAPEGLLIDVAELLLHEAVKITELLLLNEAEAVFRGLAAGTFRAVDAGRIVAALQILRGAENRNAETATDADAGTCVTCHAE